MYVSDVQSVPVSVNPMLQGGEEVNPFIVMILAMHEMYAPTMSLLAATAEEVSQASKASTQFQHFSNEVNTSIGNISTAGASGTSTVPQDVIDYLNTYKPTIDGVCGEDTPEPPSTTTTIPGDGSSVPLSYPAGYTATGNVSGGHTLSVTIYDENGHSVGSCSVAEGSSTKNNMISNFEVSDKDNELTITYTGIVAATEPGWGYYDKDGTFHSGNIPSDEEFNITQLTSVKGYFDNAVSATTSMTSQEQMIMQLIMQNISQMTSNTTQLMSKMNQLLSMIENNMK